MGSSFDRATYKGLISEETLDALEKYWRTYRTPWRKRLQEWSMENIGYPPNMIHYDRWGRQYTPSLLQLIYGWLYVKVFY